MNSNDFTNPFDIQAPTLEGYWLTLCDELTRACDNLDHPWSLPVLATQGFQIPKQRILVLRDFESEPFLLTMYTDRRSGKVAEIEESPQVSWLFYHPHWRVQLGLRGIVRVHRDGNLVDAAWERTRPTSRVPYRSPISPGAVLDTPDENISTPNEEQGRRNFCVLITEIHFVEVFLLRLQGNLRAIWESHGGPFQGTWRQP
ncbi:MAG: hypothetical protein KDA80_00920 [Planctomycetaceae bacterium]|nr:hypothetical protein [Planctomycetaceae bacterium]